MRTVLICTVGTSLKVNLKSPDAAAIREMFVQGNTKGVASALAMLPPGERLMGAEINSITSILQRQMLSQRDHLYLLVSDTEDGRFVGEVLKKYYTISKNHMRFDNAEVRVLKGLTDASAQRFRTEGLRNLVKEIASVVKRHGSNTILINATGGYKAQISFAGMIGQALEIPVCYLFERFSEVIELPPQPISMDLSFWLAHVGLFFDLAGEGVESFPVDIDERFAGLVDEIENDGQKLVGLSAVGQLFHETFCYRFHLQSQQLLPPDSKLAPKDKIIKYEDGNASKHKGLAGWLENIREVPYVVRIYTHYYNQGLSVHNCFRSSRKGVLSQIESGFSDGKATTRFDIITTAKTEAERDAAVAHLNTLCL